MKTSLLIFLLLQCLTSGAQTNLLQEDTNQRFLMAPNPDRILYKYDGFNSWYFGKTPVRTKNRFDLVPRYNPGLLDYIGSYFYDWIVVGKNLCGTLYYDSGAMKSKCECINDSIPHGKFVSWDEYGKVSNVAYYYKGNITSQKYYYNGKLSHSYKYKIVNGTSQMHGNQYTYNDSLTTVTNYVEGAKSGKETLLKNGKIIKESVFEGYFERSIVEFNENGDTIRTQYFEQTGNYFNKKPIGTWLYFDATDSTKSYISYVNGEEFEITTWKDGYMSEYHVNNFNNSSKHYFYNRDGVMISEFDTKIYEFYTPPPPPGSYYMPGGPDAIKEQFIYWGKIDFDTCVIHFDATQSTREHPYLICYKMQGSDTLEQFYAVNDNRYFQTVLYSNKFINDDGTYKRHGTWHHFDNNKIVSITEYDKGVRHGNFLLFDTTGAESRPLLAGEFKNNLQHGEWIYMKDNFIEVTNYSDGAKNGIFLKVNRETDTTAITADTYQSKTPTTHPQKNREITEILDTLYSMNYQNDSLTGEVLTFHKNGVVHWKGFMKNGVPDGQWLEYPENGSDPIQYGSVINGIPEKDWRYRFIKKNGKEVYRKLKTTPELPTSVLQEPSTHEDRLRDAQSAIQ